MNDQPAAVPESLEHHRRLREAMRRARLTEAERSDVIVDLREAEIARLQLLQEELAEVFADVPEGADLLECALQPGTPPRLWIDVLAFVAMGRDKRTYRFLQDGRYGRKVVLETTSLEEMAARVTDYVAHRLIERERALAADTLPEPAAPAVTVAARRGPMIEATHALAFVFGLFVGAVALFAFGVWYATP